MTQQIWIFSAASFCFLVGICNVILRVEGHSVFFSRTRIHIGLFSFLALAAVALPAIGGHLQENTLYDLIRFYMAKCMDVLTGGFSFSQDIYRDLPRKTFQPLEVNYYISFIKLSQFSTHGPPSLADSRNYSRHVQFPSYPCTFE